MFSLFHPQHYKESLLVFAAAAAAAAFDCSLKSGTGSWGGGGELFSFSAAAVTMLLTSFGFGFGLLLSGTVTRRGSFSACGDSALSSREGQLGGSDVDLLSRSFSAFKASCLQKER